MKWILAFFTMALLSTSAMAQEELPSCDEYDVWAPEPWLYEQYDQVVHEGVIYTCGLRDVNAYHWCNETWAEPGTWWGDLAWTDPEACE